MILALTVASLAACGQTAAATAPDTLTVTVTTPASSAARTFTASGANILADGIAQCANILRMPNNQSLAPDGAFWSMLDRAVGQRIEPD